MYMNDLFNLSKKIDDLQNELDKVKAQMSELLKQQGVVDVREMVVPLLARAGKQGATIRELKRDSRMLGRLDKATIAHALGQMIDDGQVVLQELPTTSGRGRPRIAYVWVGNGL